MTAETIISTMVDRIVGRFQPSRVVLFGSQARGDANEWSDVDLLVVLPNGTDRRHAAVEIHRTLGDLPVAKDIVVTTPEEDRSPRSRRRRCAVCGASGRQDHL